MYRQRIDPHAQVEIQDLAKLVGGIIEPLFPISWHTLVNT
jgi:thymidylate synthase (FAD)